MSGAKESGLDLGGRTEGFLLDASVSYSIVSLRNAKIVQANSNMAVATRRYVSQSVQKLQPSNGGDCQG